MDIPFATLRTEMEVLCGGLEQLVQQLQAKTIPFDRAEQLWKSVYGPKARILAEAMLNYVPSGDPRIIVEFEDTNRRMIKSDAVNCIEAPLSEELAVTHLSTVMKQLRDLTTYLPE